MLYDGVRCNQCHYLLEICECNDELYDAYLTDHSNLVNNYMIQSHNDSMHSLKQNAQTIFENRCDREMLGDLDE